MAYRSSTAAYHIQLLIVVASVLACLISGCTAASLPSVNIQWDDTDTGFIRTNVQPVPGGFDI